MGILSGYSDAELFYSVILSRLFQIQGDLQAADREIRKAVDRMNVQSAVVVREEVISQQVRIHLARGDLLAAERALKGYGEPFKDGFSFAAVPDQAFQPRQAVLYIGALRILLHRARAERGLAELKPGIALAGSLIEAALQDGYVPFALELLLVRAGLHAALGDGPAGRTDVARALELGQPEGYLSIFVEEGPALAAGLNDLLERDRTGKVRPEYIRQILAAFQVSPPSPASAEDSIRLGSLNRTGAGGAGPDGGRHEVRRDRRKVIHLPQYGPLARQGHLCQARRRQPHQGHRNGPPEADPVNSNF